MPVKDESIQQDGDDVEKKNEEIVVEIAEIADEIVGNQIIDENIVVNIEEKLTEVSNDDVEIKEKIKTKSSPSKKEKKKEKKEKKRKRHEMEKGVKKKFKKIFFFFY